MECFKTYDDFRNIVLADYKDASIIEILNIQYIILFRMWNLLEKTFDEFSRWDNSVLVPSKDSDGLIWEEYGKYKISDLLMLNYDKLYAYSERECSDLKNKAGDIVETTDITPAFSYDHILENGKSIFETFFPNSSPLLGVKKYDEQILPSRQIKDHHVSLVLNEVGTGKTISALYSISDIIEDCNKAKQDAKILIVCPSNLKKKWEEDIRYNLGRYSYVMKRGEESEKCFSGSYKKVFFRDNEQCIFIMDNISSKKGEMCSFKNNANSFSTVFSLLGIQDDSELWDLIIIDECHLCNKNYTSLRAKNLMMLTATPIVTFDHNDNGEDVDSLDIYKNIMQSILQTKINVKIKPLDVRISDEKKLFTNFFREDLSIPATERVIVFKETERMDGYAKMVARIAAAKNWLVADHFAQDDEYLLSKYKYICKESLDISLDFDAKKEVLKEITEELEEEKNCPALIVFCEHQEVVKNLYSYFKDFRNHVVAMKCGSMEKINRESSGNVIQALHQYIRKQAMPVILIITGRIGGTGLNMGDFDAVVHYELPYTSIALEQRFGRIDRMQGGREGVKKMYFILNKETASSEDSVIQNRFFWFCVSKLNSTCKYIPVRNTVLFYPKMAERIQKHFLNIINHISRQDLGNEASVTMRQLEKTIREKYEQLYGSLLDGSLTDWYGYSEPEEIQDDILRELIIKHRDNQKRIEKHKKACDAFRRFVNEYDHIIDLFDEDTSDHIQMPAEKFIDDVVIEEQEDYDDNNIIAGEDEGNSEEESIAELLIDEEDSATTENESDLQKRYDEKREKILRINPNKFSDKLSNGIYYYENDGLVITTVEQYRGEAINEQD